MPVLAIVAAGAAWGLGGAAAIGAVAAGTATLAVTLTAVATVGATLGAIGAITHDKTLSTIGTVMGAVGGIGALAANAGLFGAEATTASLFGSDPIPVSVAAPDIAAEAAAGNDLSSLANMPGLPGAEAVSATGEFAALPAGAIDTATSAASGEADSLINGGGGGMKTLVGQNVDEATNQLVKGAGGGSIPSGSPTDQASINAAGKGSAGVSASDLGLPAKGQYVGEVATAADGTPVSWSGTAWTKQDGGFLSGIMKSPMAQYGLVQSAGAFLSGAFDPLKPAQVDALNAQAAANKASTAKMAQETQNMQGKLPVASRVTGAPAPLGMINNSPVTGQVAA